MPPKPPRNHAARHGGGKLRLASIAPRHRTGTDRHPYEARLRLAKQARGCGWLGARRRLLPGARQRPPAGGRRRDYAQVGAYCYTLQVVARHAAYTIGRALALAHPPWRGIEAGVVPSLAAGQRAPLPPTSAGGRWLKCTSPTVLVGGWLINTGGKVIVG